MRCSVIGGIEGDSMRCTMVNEEGVMVCGKRGQEKSMPCLG